MHRLRNPVRPYAWGSSTHIPRLCGLPATGEPMAEMWFGAHPADPSTVEDGRGLDRLIASDPTACLGHEVEAAFGPRLPFMMKLLAAARPLSLQVHPDSEQAARGFAQEDADGTPLGDASRSYQDPFHKPELIYALTRFEGMAGFRDTSKSAAILRMFELDLLDGVAEELDQAESPADGLRRVVTRLLGRSEEETARDLPRLRAAAVAAERRSHHPRARHRPPQIDASSVQRESLRVFAQTVELVDQYPRDPGVLVTLLLNHVVLAAGEAMFIDAGVMHAYTSGFGVEIMAASDNVLRAGLTPKHVDVPGLLEITDFAPIPPPRWTARKDPSSGAVALTPPVDDFELLMAELCDHGSMVQLDGPGIALCLEGRATVTAAGETLDLEPGEACFIPARDGRLRLSGKGRAAVARTPG